MTRVDLDNIGMSIPDRQQAVEWLYDRYGPVGNKWNIDQLTYVTFENDKHATHFIMRFS